MDRRQFLSRAALASAALALRPHADPALADAAPTLDDARALFDLDPSRIHLAGLLLTSHPKPVREAIERHRRQFDADPAGYWQRNNNPERARVRSAASRYWAVAPEDVALTDSTTMGIALLYQGVSLRPGQELLTTTHDHFITHRSLEWRARRSGAPLRYVSLYDDPATTTPGEQVARAVAAIREETRVLAVTWVHSSTGVKLDLGALSAALAEINARRDEGDRVLLCVDGVHGFGVEDEDMRSLGCDYFSAGCHKWLHGPRGTGVLFATDARFWAAVEPTIPPFGRGDLPGEVHSPGGFHAFEHRWALAEAFELHLALGKARVAAHVRGLARQYREGLAAMPKIRLQTPISERVSSGIVVFDVAGRHPREVVRRLLDRGIVASRSPYGTRSVRLSPTIVNTSGEIERVLREIRALA